MNYPYGEPDQYRQQQELEEERQRNSLDALARVHQLIAEKGMHPSDLKHLQCLLYECGISELAFNLHISKREAA